MRKASNALNYLAMAVCVVKKTQRMDALLRRRRRAQSLQQLDASLLQRQVVGMFQRHGRKRSLQRRQPRRPNVPIQTPHAHARQLMAP